MSQRRSELFAAIPFRLYRALEAEEITGAQFVLLERLIYRCGRDFGETAFKLSALKDELPVWPRGSRRYART
jgi:hypothetical protein